MIELDGESLSVPQIAAAAAHPVQVVLSGSAQRRMEASYRQALYATEHRPIYGRTTGVGANRDVNVSGGTEQALALLRSHATSAGAVRSERRVRAMLVVRLNQMAAGGSGASPKLASGLAEMINRDALPVVREYVGIGTGDLGALAATGLALIGEARTTGPLPPTELGVHEALPLLSSNAATVGDAALASADLTTLARASVLCAALSCRTLHCNQEAFAAAVDHATPFVGARRCTHWLRLLVGTPDSERIQDPFSVRCIPQVHGLLLDCVAELTDVVQRYANAPQENPLFLAENEVADAVVHHGSFHATYLESALATALRGAADVARLSVRRLCLLDDPYYTGLRAFLADERPGSSGAMALEYVATAALNELAAAATPRPSGAVLSRGVEDDASFASTGARRALAAGQALRVVLASEGVAAGRAAGMGGDDSLSPPLKKAVELCGGGGRNHKDRDLTPDIDLVSSRMGELAALLPDSDTDSGSAEWQAG